MPELTSRQMVALVFAAVASIGLAVLAFAPERFSMGPPPVVLLSVILIAVSVFASAETQGREQYVRVLWILALLAAALLPLLLMMYLFRMRPEHIVIPSIGGCLLGLLIGMFLYRTMENHLTDGIIIYEGTVLFQETQIVLITAGAVALYVLAVLSSGNVEMLFWLLLCAFSAHILYLAVAVLRLELKTGQRIRFAYPQKMSHRRRLVVTILWLIVFVLYVFTVFGHR